MTSEIIKTDQVLGQTMDVYGTIENPLFLAKDVATWIGHTNPTVMVQSVDRDEKRIIRLGTLNNVYSAHALTEHGLYEVLMLSRKPIARQFKKGVKKVLSELRTQGYVKAENITRTQLANMILEAEEELAAKSAELEVANERIELDAPRVNYVSHFFDANGTMSIGEMAKTFSIRPNTMFQMLRDDGYLMIRASSRNVAKQPYVDAGYFEIKITVKNGNQFRQTRVTPRGHGYFAKRYNLFPMTIVNPI